MNMASKISDQLNRLKVEELALQNLVRLQNEELEMKSKRYNTSSAAEQAGNVEYANGGNDVNEYLEKGDKPAKNVDNESIIPLNLVVNKFHHHDVNMIEEEEDDDDDELESSSQKITAGHDDIEQFVNSL